MTVELEGRVSSLESWRQEVSLQRAVEAERQKHLDERFDTLEKGLAGIHSALNRALWAVGVIVLAAITSFILNGGLSIVPK